MEIILTANSPGEVGAWVRATVAELKASHPEARITVALVPCPFATGAEARVAESLPGVDRVLTPWHTMLGILGLRKLPAVQRPAVVGYLGGELLHALGLGWRLGLPTVGYLVKPSFWGRYFTRIGLARAQDQEAAGHQARFCGDLRVDGVQRNLPGLTRSQTGPVLGLFPGSRAIHLRATLGVYLRAAEWIAERVPDLKVVLALSPFVDRASVEAAMARPLLPLPVSRGEFVEAGLITERGLSVEVLWGKPYEAIERLDLALCIPGTNTAELACAGKPFLVTLHPLAQIGGGGLFGLLDRLPLGPLKPYLRLRKQRRLRFTAYPNYLANEMIAPEILVADDLSNLCDQSVELLLNPEDRKRIGTRLQEAMGPPGAARALAELMVETVA